MVSAADSQSTENTTNYGPVPIVRGGGSWIDDRLKMTADVRKFISGDQFDQPVIGKIHFDSQKMVSNNPPK